MSNVIRDTEKLQQKQIETSKRRHDRELKNMDNIHEAIKTDLKKANTAELVSIEQSHHVHLDEQNVKKEKVLEEMKSHLQQTKDLTEKELKALKEHAMKERSNTEVKLSSERERLVADHNLYLEDLNNRLNESSKKVNHEGEKRIETTKEFNNRKYLNLETQNEEKIQEQTQQFTTKFKADQRNYQTMKDTQDNQFKKERMSTNLRQQDEMKKMTDVHTNLLEKKDKNYRKVFKDQDLFFEDKYNKQLQRHTSDFKTLEDKSKKVVEDLKSAMTKEITTTVQRSDDKFYQFEALKPVLQNTEDGVVIKVKVPEHSKQDLQLSVNGKEAIVSYNRRYSDANKLTDGTINKVNKVESFTTRLPTSHVLNAKTVKSSYEDGIMTYTIKRA